MSDGQQDQETEEENGGQPGGWFTSPQSESLNGISQKSSNFFDRPPFLFAAFMWLFPYGYIILIGITIWAIVCVFQTFGARASDIVPLDFIKALIVFLPFLFFLFISTKGTWFLNRVFFLLPVWLFLVWTMGVTQGAMMAALSRAYGVGQ